MKAQGRTAAAEAGAFEAVAARAARAAGDVLRERFGAMAGVPVEFKRNEVDLVTEVDRAAEAAALAVIREACPGHRIVSEETASSSEGIREPGHAWIVDPLDGTTNYIQGIPMFCVSVAVYRDGAPLLGLVYDPLREEAFHAVRGGGAFLNGEPVRVSAGERLIRCVLATGTAVGRFGEWPHLVADLAAVGPRAGNVRFLGTAALHLAYVACGRLDGFWEHRLSPWDLAAGALLTEEAGGRVTRPDGAPFTLESHAILATNGRIHDEMVALLATTRGGGADGAA